MKETIETKRACTQRHGVTINKTKDQKRKYRNTIIYVGGLVGGGWGGEGGGCTTDEHAGSQDGSDMVVYVNN